MASPAAVLSVLVKADGIVKTNQQLKGLHGGLGAAGKAGSRMGTDLDKGARTGSKSLGLLKSAAGPAIAAFGAVGIAGAVKSAVSEFQEARKVGANTNAVIKSTGGVANVSAKHVASLATSISKKVGIDDEAIQSGSNLLLTFKNIRNETGKGKDIFDQATKAAVDLSAAGFGSLSSTSKQLGKALNDPVKGMTALGRSGVTFSENQKKAIEALLKTGKAADRVKAQQIILKEVQSQVGGQAAAQATTMDKLKVTLGNLAEAAGSVLVPALDKVGRFLVTVINQMIEGKSTGGAIVSVFKSIGGVIGSVVGAIKSIVSGFREGKTWAVLLVTAVGALTAGFVAYKTIMLISAAASKAMAAAQVAINVAMSLNPIGLVIAAIVGLVAGLVIAYKKSETFRGIVDALWGVIKTVTGAVWNFLTSLKDLPGKLWDAGKAITQGVINGIKALPGLLKDAATWLWDKLKAGLEAYLTAYTTVGTWILNRVIDGFKVITSLLSSVGGWLLNRFTDFIKLEIAGVKAVGGWLLNRIVDGFKVITGLLATVGGWIKNRIVDFIQLEVSGFTNIGSWVVNRVVDGFKVVTKALESVGGWLKNRLVEIFDGVKKAFVGIGGTLIGWIVDGLKGGVNLLIDFINTIIGVINKIPGVDVGKVKHLAEGGTTATKAQALAQGGVVNRPLVMMGEEAPRHPEYVIPTNPAYRGRAVGLLSQAAGALGLAQGGMFSIQDMADLWRSKGGAPGIADTMGVIGFAESHGDPNARNPSGATGLWQILGQLVPGNLRNPGVNALNAIAKYAAQGLHAWDASRSVWSKMVGTTTGPSLSDILGKLPGVGDLPGWLKGTGTYVLGKVKDWIGDKVGSLIGPRVPSGGIPKGMAGSVQDAITLAMSMGFGYPSLGQLTGGQHAQGSLHYLGRAVDFGTAGHTANEMQALWAALIRRFGSHINELFFDPMPFYIDNFLKHAGAFGGHGDHIHVGFRKGGLFGDLPFAGSFGGGGVVPGPLGAPAAAVVHGGERIGGDGPLVNIETMNVGSRTDENAWLARLGFKLATA